MRLTIPPGEVKNKKELAFKDMMISQFQQNIPNFGDRDVSKLAFVKMLCYVTYKLRFTLTAGTCAFSYPAKISTQKLA